MKFELNRLADYSNKEIIKEIQRVADLLNLSPLSSSAFDKKSKVAKSTVIRRFGGWKEALEAASLGHLYTGQVVSKRMREQRNRSVTDEELLIELRRVATLVARKDISSKDITSHATVDRNIFANRFGSIKSAIELAGLTTRIPGAARAVHTQESLFSNLYDVWTHYGRQPHYSEMDKAPSKIKSKNYTNRFGTWRKALSSFIGYVEKSTDKTEHKTPESLPIQKNEGLEKILKIVAKYLWD